MYNILYLEDNPLCLMDSFNELQKAINAKVFCAKNFDEADILLNSNRFDLFILDIEIKDSNKSGIHFAQKLRRTSEHSETPILFTSMYSHFSSYLLNQIKHCSFISKPINYSELLLQVGVLLGIPEFVKNYYSPQPLLIPTNSGYIIEINPSSISYIELSSDTLIIQDTNGETTKIKNHPGLFKNILNQINKSGDRSLRQIYRSIIINVNQIQCIEIHKNTADVYLFGDSISKPLGNKYRDNILEFLK